MNISVIIPTYNYSGYIKQAIESVIQQDYLQNNVEIIVIDDGSTDDTKAQLQSYVDARIIQYYYQPNTGKAAATQKGIALATGDIVFNLDADDWFLPGKISKTVAVFSSYPQLALVSSPAIIHHVNGTIPDIAEPVPNRLLGTIISGPLLLKYFFEHKMLFGGGSTFAGKKSILEKIYWDPSIDMYTDEWLLIETMLKGDCYFLHEPLSVWRVHENNYSGNSTVNLESKQKRLGGSSETILNLILAGDYPIWLKKTYQLKHEVRKMVWLEATQQKTATAWLQFFKRGILSGNSFSILNNYHAFNRLLSPGLRKFLKG